jgi:hypothetical protein
MQDNQEGVIITHRNGVFTAQASWHGTRATIGASFKTEADAKAAGQLALDRLREPSPRQ